MSRCCHHRSSRPHRSWGPSVERSSDGVEHRGVQPIGATHLADRPCRRKLRERASEASPAVTLPAEVRTAERHEHGACRARAPLVDEVGGRGARGSVVDADVCDASAVRHVGDERDHRDAESNELVHRRADLRRVRGLEDHALRTAAGDAGEGAHDVGGRAGVLKVEPRADDRGSQVRQLRLERPPHCRREPWWRLHHEVDEERPSSDTQLARLPVELGDRLLDLRHGALPHARSPVEHTIDGRQAQAGLLGDLAHSVRMGHVARLTLRCF